MPFRKAKTWRRRKKKSGTYVRVKKNRNPKLPKTLVPNVYYFNRSQVFDVSLGTLSSESPQGVFWQYVDGGTPGGDGRVAAVAQFSFNLQQLTDWTEFANLFTFYKIPAVSFKVYLSTGIGGGTVRDNSQCIVYTMPYSVPLAPADLAGQTKEENFLCSQIFRRALLMNDNTTKPNISMYMKLKQAGELYDSSTSTPYMQHPKWIPFDAGNNPQTVPHYGALQRIQTVNNSSLPGVNFKCIVKYYIMCKRVR